MVDRSVVSKPDVFLAHDLSIIASDEDEKHMSTATALILTSVFMTSALVCALALGLLS